MRDLPLVSVVIPVYNVDEYIEATLQSVVEQTYGNIETIIVDDGSTDRTGEIAQRFCEDRRFRYVRQDNQGPSAARNHGVRVASGEFVAFLDGDDVWAPTKIADQVDVFGREPGVVLVATNYSFMDRQGTTIEPMIFRESPPGLDVDARQTIYRRCPSWTCTVMMRREWFAAHGGFDESLHWAEDYDMWMRVVQTGGQMRFLMEPLAGVRCRPGSLMSRNVDAYPGLLKVIERAIQRESDPGWRRVLLGSRRRYTREMRSFQVSEEAASCLPEHPWRALWRLISAWSYYPKRRRLLLWAAAIATPGLLGGARIRATVKADMELRHNCRRECFTGKSTT